jgi:hypothetical protein
LKHPRFGADMAWELTKRGSKDYVGVQSHPKYNVKFANHDGHISIKTDCDEEEILREPPSSDDEISQSENNSAYETPEDAEGTEATSDQ